nr:MAG TPA: Neuroendocrine protein 7B2 precursor (Secretogranin V) [Caudoviricetes sp.]
MTPALSHDNQAPECYQRHTNKLLTTNKQRAIHACVSLFLPPTPTIKQCGTEHMFSC